MGEDNTKNKGKPATILQPVLKPATSTVNKPVTERGTKW